MNYFFWLFFLYKHRRYIILFLRDRIERDIYHIDTMDDFTIIKLFKYYYYNIS